MRNKRYLSARFSLAVQNRIEGVTDGFINEISPPGLLIDSMIHTATDCDFITLPFIVKDGNSFLYPNFQGIPERPPERRLSARFKSAFDKGEKAEFAVKDLKTARKHYLSSLHFAVGESDSVKALNALGRISVKLHRFEDVFDHYSIIILNYVDVTGARGLPYVYYAILQLLKTSNPDNKEKILPVVKYCLEKMKTGLIPLNYSTEELLIHVSEWNENNAFNSPGSNGQINELVKNINQQLRFVDAFGTGLSERNAERKPK